MKIKEEWVKISVKVDALSMRERVMIFFTVVFLLYMIVNLLLLEPANQQRKKISAQVMEQQNKIKVIQDQVDSYVLAKSAQANLPQRERLNQIKLQIAEGEAFLKHNNEKLVRPDRMADVLRQVLGKNANLELVSLKTIPVTSLIEAAEEQEEETEGAVKSAKITTLVMKENKIYKHGVTMTVRGSYAGLLQYLSELERLPTQMLWGDIKLEVVKYPTAELTVTVYTLSLDRVWLQV